MATSTATPTDSLDALKDRAFAFDAELKRKKAGLAPPGVWVPGISKPGDCGFWYPYEILRGNFGNIALTLTGVNRDLLNTIAPKRAVDFGAADGDLSFFLEREGWQMTIIDHAPTNFNGLEGARLLKQTLHSSVEIRDIDLDAQFTMEGMFDVVFLLGTLYHLKNPFYMLETLSKSARYCFLSTKMMRWSAPRSSSRLDDVLPWRRGQDRLLLETLPVAYLLGPDECNADATNFWVFSEGGLRRIFDRTGWTIVDFKIFGNADDADPFTIPGDARAFCLLKSRNVT